MDIVKKQGRNIINRIPTTQHQRGEDVYKKTVLPNGIRVVTEEIPHVRSVSVGLWFETGSRNETPENNGISHFIEHMVFKGTKNRSVKEIAQSIESVGGYHNAFTSKEHTCYYARVLDEHVELAIDVLSDLALNPLFPAKELEKEKGVVLEELKQIEDDPDDIIHDYFEKAIYGEHPLGMPVIGTEKSVKNFNRRQLLQYCKQHYTADNLVVAVAGNVRHDTVINLVNKYVSGLKRSSVQRIPVTSGDFTVSTNRILMERPIQQAHICIGGVAYGIKDKRRHALQVLNTLLGEGMSSLLFQNIREKYGFTYSIYSYHNMLIDTGSFGVYVGTDKKHIDKCIELVWKELNDLRRKPISQKDLTRTKDQLKGSMMLGLENIPNRMIRLGNSELYFGELTSLNDIIQHIDAVTVENVLEVAQDLFKEDRFASVIFTPSKAALHTEQ
jgi:predicted Zn-dependent peptidase